jgi:hypothetical protein
MQTPLPQQNQVSAVTSAANAVDLTFTAGLVVGSEVSL